MCTCTTYVGRHKSLMNHNTIQMRRMCVSSVEQVFIMRNQLWWLCSGCNLGTHVYRQKSIKSWIGLKRVRKEKHIMHHTEYRYEIDRLFSYFLWCMRFSHYHYYFLFMLMKWCPVCNENAYLDRKSVVLLKICWQLFLPCIEKWFSLFNHRNRIKHTIAIAVFLKTFC